MAIFLFLVSTNATYTSNTVQNQIIDVLADQIKQQIVQKVKAAKWYTVIADEVTDASNKEQLSIVLRYVEGDSLSVREDLIGFVECDTGISGRSLANKIISFLEELGQISVVRLMMGQETWRVQLMVQLLPIFTVHPTASTLQL